MVTAYFDSNFYVWLARGDGSADAAVDELNRLAVRHVVSIPLLRELFSSRARRDANRRLHRRVTRLQIPPLVINIDFAWDALVGPPELLEQFAQVLRVTDDLATEAHSHALVAGRGLSPTQQAAWDQANPEYAGLAKSSASERDSTKAIAFARSQIEMLKGIGLNLDFDAITELLDAEQPNLAKISACLFAALGDETVAKLAQEEKMQESVTASDNRPLNLTIGEATDRQRKKLANTLRDAEHMSVFVEHQHEIDLLQVDAAQMKQIQRSRPVHHLVELDLASRCFSASCLADVVETLRRYTQAAP